MTLVVQGNHETDVLEKWVNESFSPIENKDVTLPDLGTPESFLPENLGKFI